MEVSIMLSKAMTGAINDQIQAELFSAYLYLAMSAHFQTANLGGFAHWMSVQAKEELGHAMKFYGYLTDRSAAVTLQAIPQPPSTFTTPTGIFEQSLEHEKKITGRIEKLYAQAVQENDYATQSFLQWFINEQIEEERNATQIIEELKLVGESGSALFLIDRQLASRGG
jgi:ferritin